MATKEKALALVNEVSGRGSLGSISLHTWPTVYKALCRAIEQRDAIQKEHDDYKQKVSDAAEEATEIIDHWSGDRDGAKCLQDFIIPKPQPDPLVEATLQVFPDNPFAKEHSDRIRAALDALGFEIREKNDGQLNSN